MAKDELDRIISRYTEKGDGRTEAERDLDDAIDDVFAEYTSAHASERLARQRRVKTPSALGGEQEAALLSESASGHALSLPGGARGPLMVNVALIKPGWGNRRDKNYYSREVLTRDAKVFEGVKMYATDHRPGEKSVRSEVSVIKQIVGFTRDGAPIARVAIHDPDFAEATRNRAKLGTLDSLECSILATGRTRKGTVNGQRGNIVEAITAATSVDWVTKAGAGGHAIALAESAGDDHVAEDTSETTLDDVLATYGSAHASERLARQRRKRTPKRAHLSRRGTSLTVLSGDAAFQAVAAMLQEDERLVLCDDGHGIEIVSGVEEDEEVEAEISILRD